MTIAERILAVCRDNEKNMTAFAEKTNVTPAYISKLKNNPDAVPSDRFIVDVCRQYRINEYWLRTGEGEMLIPRTQEEEIIDWIGRMQMKAVSGSRVDALKQRLILALSHIENDETWEDLYRVIKEVAAQDD